jgi:hypothetical protein
VSVRNSSGIQIQKYDRQEVNVERVREVFKERPKLTEVLQGSCGSRFRERLTLSVS